VIVYVESNFVLELAALQEQHRECEEIVKLAEGGAIRLVLPAFSVAEPYDVLRRRSAERTQLRDQLSRHIRQLSRNATYEEQLGRLGEVARILTESGRDERSRLDETLIRLLGAGEVIPVVSATVRTALGAQVNRGLAAQDSIIYASVVEHLGSAPPGVKCFLNRNAKDFLTPEIQQDLARFSCRLLSSFEDGLGFIRATLDA
jgi:predicted nucleic acid-binding protein